MQPFLDDPDPVIELGNRIFFTRYNTTVLYVRLIRTHEMRIIPSLHFLRENAQQGIARISQVPKNSQHAS